MHPKLLAAGESNTLVPLRNRIIIRIQRHRTNIKRIRQPIRSSTIRRDKVLVPPLLPQNLRQRMIIRDLRHAVVATVRAHDCVSAGVDDGAFVGGEPGGAELALACVHGASVKALFGHGVGGAVFDHGGDVEGLQALDVGVGDFAGEEAVLAVGFFDAAVAEFAGEVGERGEELGDAAHGDDLAPVPRTRIRNRRIEDRRVPNQKPMDPLCLHNSRDPQPRLIHSIVLPDLDVGGQPLPADGVPDVEHAGFLLEVLDQAAMVQGAGGGVEPVGDVALHELGGFFFEVHAAYEVLDAG